MRHDEMLPMISECNDNDIEFTFPKIPGKKAVRAPPDNIAPSMTDDDPSISDDSMNDDAIMTVKCPQSTIPHNILTFQSMKDMMRTMGIRNPIVDAHIIDDVERAMFGVMNQVNEMVSHRIPMQAIATALYATISYGTTMQTITRHILETINDRVKRNAGIFVDVEELKKHKEQSTKIIDVIEAFKKRTEDRIDEAANRFRILLTNNTKNNIEIMKEQIVKAIDDRLKSDDFDTRIFNLSAESGRMRLELQRFSKLIDDLKVIKGDDDDRILQQKIDDRINEINKRCLNTIRAKLMKIGEKDQRINNRIESIELSMSGNDFAASTYNKDARMKIEKQSMMIQKLTQNVKSLTERVKRQEKVISDMQIKMNTKTDDTRRSTTSITDKTTITRSQSAIDGDANIQNDINDHDDDDMVIDKMDAAPTAGFDYPHTKAPQRDEFNNHRSTADTRPRMTGDEDQKDDDYEPTKDDDQLGPNANADDNVMNASTLPPSSIPSTIAMLEQKEEDALQ